MAWPTTSPSRPLTQSSFVIPSQSTKRSPFCWRVVSNPSDALLLRATRGEDGRPARDFGPDKAVEDGRAALGLGWHRAAELSQSFAYHGFIECLIEGIGKLGDHFARDALARKQPRPDAHFVVYARLRGGRHIRQHRQALAGGNSVGLDRARQNLLRHAHRLLAQQV